MPSAPRRLAIEQVGATDGERNSTDNRGACRDVLMPSPAAARFGGSPEALYASANVPDRWLRGARVVGQTAKHTLDLARLVFSS